MNRYLDYDELDVVVSHLAYRCSDNRKLENNIRWVYDYIRSIPSTREEMLDDWTKACTMLVYEYIVGKLGFNHISSKCYAFFESSWLKDLKELIAYYNYLEDDTKTMDEHYFQAITLIRDKLFSTKHYSLNDFKNVKDYLREYYLNDNFIDVKNPGTYNLIARKAERIQNTTGNKDDKQNWYRAEFYVKKFYNNIIPAIESENEELKQKHIIEILKAFEFSKSKENRFLIINSFEAAIAIFFLDKNTLRNVLGNPDSYIMSLSPVTNNWPLKGNGDTKLKYSEDGKLVVYDGVMSEEERNYLLSGLDADELKQKIDDLYRQSRLEPFEANVL
jgi:hypothetical protein